jgi:hypothetical protein
MKLKIKVVELICRSAELPGAFNKTCDNCSLHKTFVSRYIFPGQEEQQT